jgi:predicted RNA-binding Zn-ribbon protein involved in translation (DUF1610 family)
MEDGFKERTTVPSRKLTGESREGDDEYSGECPNCGADISRSHRIGLLSLGSGAIEVGGVWVNAGFRSIGAQCPDCGVALVKDITRSVALGTMMSAWRLKSELE